MSGIAGHLTFDRRPASRELVERMMASVPERGPDGVSTWSGGHVVLGHQLLATTPEEPAGRQPLELAGTRLVITCDGTLYNRPALIARLAGPAGPVRILSGEPDALLVGGMPNTPSGITWSPLRPRRRDSSFGGITAGFVKQDLSPGLPAEP